MSLSKRVASLLKSVVGETVEDIENLLYKNGNLFDEKISKWEEKANHNYFEEKEAFQERDEQVRSDGIRRNVSSYPKHLVDDLKLFDLSPPSTLNEVKKARNREIKKFHPDKFVKDDEKSETSKRILQIYNSAFERLKKYYEENRGV